MRSVKVLLATTILVLALAGAAHAGCMATVGLSSVPTGVAPGETWGVDLNVLQHGQEPLSGATPTVILTEQASGQEKVFDGRADRYEGPLPRRRRVPERRDLVGRGERRLPRRGVRADAHLRLVRHRRRGTAAVAAPGRARAGRRAERPGVVPLLGARSRSGRARDRGRGAGHAPRTSATAVAASPSPRPVKPRPSVVVARTATRPAGTPMAAARSGLHLAADRGEPRALSHEHAVGVHELVPALADDLVGPPEQVERRGALPALVPGREQPADVPEPGSPEQRVHQRVREDVPVGVPDEPAARRGTPHPRERAALPARGRARPRRFPP